MSPKRAQQPQTCKKCGREFPNWSALRGHLQLGEGIVKPDKATWAAPESGGVSAEKVPESGGVSAEKVPESGGVSAEKAPESGGVSAEKVPESGGVVAQAFPEEETAVARAVPEERRQSMRYQCGDRWCTDAELDNLEAIKRGDKRLMDKDEAVAVMTPDLSGLEAKLEEIAKAQGIRVDTESLIRGVSQELVRQGLKKSQGRGRPLVGLPFSDGKALPRGY